MKAGNGTCLRPTWSRMRPTGWRPLQPAAICLDFPQDFIAREMPVRHVYNHEFVAHHAVFAAGIPFVEDLKDLGRLRSGRPFLMAVPLRTSCVDGAPMRAVALEW